MDKLLNEFSFGLFIWQTVLFIALIFLLRKYAWGPILDAVNEREEGIKDALTAADKARQEMLDIKSDNDKILKEARAERDSLLKDAREIKEKMLANAKEEAQVIADASVEKTKLAIANEKNAAIAAIKKEMGELSVSIAEKVIKRELADKNKQVQLIEQLLNDVTLN